MEEVNYGREVPMQIAPRFVIRQHVVDAGSDASHSILSGATRVDGDVIPIGLGEVPAFAMALHGKRANIVVFSHVELRRESGLRWDTVDPGIVGHDIP